MAGLGTDINSFFNQDYIEYLETDTQDFSKQILENKQKEIEQRELQDANVAVAKPEQINKMVLIAGISLLFIAGITVVVLKKKGVI